MAVFKDKGIDNITTENASPSPELTLEVVKLLMNHRTVATIAFHKPLLISVSMRPAGHGFTIPGFRETPVTPSAPDVGYSTFSGKVKVSRLRGEGI